MSVVGRVALVVVLACCGCQVVTGLSKLEVVDGGTTESALSDPPDAQTSDAAPSGAAGARANRPGGKCTPPPGAACDLVGQCGCKPEARCQARGPAFAPACYVAGALEPGSVCENASDCPRGQTCDARTCRTYCRNDGDCSDGACVDVRSTDARSRGVRVCAVRCVVGEPNRCGPGARCRVITPDVGTYCAAPDDPCPTTEDGVCDEARGTGQCAEGTDARDCACSPVLPDAVCDPVEQCGCAKGNACVLMLGGAGVLTAACRAWTGQKTQDARCASDDECAPGHACEPGGSCARLCRDDAQCGENGVCAKVVVGSKSHAGLSTCHTRCDRANSGCAAELRCAHFDQRFPIEGDFCAAPVAECRTLDGVCDEARGSGLCTDDTDVVDCCQSSLPKGVCDLVAQCGCEKQPGTGCAEVTRDGEVRSTACVTPGYVPVDSWCLDDSTCVRGAGCYGHVCRAYCEDDAGCRPGGRCIFGLRNGVASSLKVCVGPCNPETNAPCGENTRCTSGTLEDAPADACTFVPLTTGCPKGDGRCDEPEGTGICAEAEDPEDC